MSTLSCREGAGESRDDGADSCGGPVAALELDVLDELPGAGSHCSRGQSRTACMRRKCSQNCGKLSSMGTRNEIARGYPNRGGNFQVTVCCNNSCVPPGMASARCTPPRPCEGVRDEDVLACWLVLGTGQGGGHDWDGVRARASALRTLDALGPSAWAHLHRGLLPRRALRTLCGLARGMALATLHQLDRAPSALQGMCAARVATLAWAAGGGAAATPPPEEIIMVLACHGQPLRLDRRVWAWLTTALDRVGGKDPVGPGAVGYSEGCIRQLLGLLLCSGGATLASHLSPRALLAVQALADAAAGDATPTQVLARALLHARAVAGRVSAQAASRERARRALSWLASPVRTRVGALAEDRALHAVPRCMVCTGRAVDDLPATAWRVLPCACMLHAACFDAWTAANTKFWDRPACVCCCANLAHLVAQTLLT